MEQHNHSHSEKGDGSGNHQGHGNRDPHHHHEEMIADFKKRFWISMVITIPVVLLAPMIQNLLGFEIRFEGDSYLQLALSSAAFFYGGWPFLKGMAGELRKKSPAMMTLIALAISVAYLYSAAVVLGLEGKTFFWELVTLIDIMLLGHWIEMKSIMRASGALQELAKMIPSEATRFDVNGDSEVVSISEIKTGDLVLARPGEKIPADGSVEEGESMVNESMLTGESRPVVKKQGDQVIAGSINDAGALRIRVSQTGGNTFLNRVIKMVETAQSSKSRTQDLASRAAGWLFYLALFSGFSTLIVWLLIGKEFAFALERMVTVMIISCPHALGLAVPLVVAISTAASARRGLLIRNRAAFENARKIDVVIFDKTGTLTKGEFGLTRVLVLDESHSRESIVRIAAGLEVNSEHPIAGGILREADAMGISPAEVTKFTNITGKGIQGKLDGKEIKMVSPGYLNELNFAIPKEAMGNDSETVVFLLEDGKLVGCLALADEIREESFEAIRILKEQGIRVEMATGDNEKVAASVSSTLQLDAYHAEVLPEDKQHLIREFQAKGKLVAMTGDGVNDAPALAQADVGIAIGSGTDVAAETADIVLVNSNPMDIAKLILFGKATYRKIVQNLFWAAGYNILAVPLAVGVLAPFGILVSPAIGAVLMSLSTIIVAINAQLLKKQIA